MDAAPPASSSSSTTPAPGVPHGCVFELHHILEDWITENTAGVLSLPSRKWTAGLVKIDGHQRRIAGVTAVLSNLEDTKRLLRQVQTFKRRSVFSPELCVRVQRNAPQRCTYYRPSSTLVQTWDPGPEPHCHTPHIVQCPES